MTQWQGGLTHSLAMLRTIPLILALIVPRGAINAQPSEPEYRVYTEHPRLFLGPQRLRLLKRERERQSVRWTQFDALIAGKARLPEPGFALALYFLVSGDASAGHQAIDWALNSGADLRQLALVYDWCQSLLTPAQQATLAAKIEKALKAIPESPGLTVARDRALAEIAIAERDMDGAETALRNLYEQWWKMDFARKLNTGSDLDPGDEIYATIEFLHALHDNLGLDARGEAGEFFKRLPNFLVACNYPAPYPASENEYWIPVFNGSGEPNLKRAALARAAGLALVAYDSNATENQYLQGWLMQDRFQLQSAFGAPYEFLWANPYQPGLAYSDLPLIFHDARSGALFVRSSWDEDAAWFALYEGQSQLFRDGRISVLSRETNQTAAIHIGSAAVVAAKSQARFIADAASVFVTGLKPETRYRVEVDDEEMNEFKTDRAGTLALQFADGRSPGVRIEEAWNGTK